MSTKISYDELKAAIVVIHKFEFLGEFSVLRDIEIIEAYATLFKFAGLEEKKDEENG